MMLEFEGGWIEIGGGAVIEGVLYGAEIEMSNPHPCPHCIVSPNPHIRRLWGKGNTFMLNCSYDCLMHQEDFRDRLMWMNCGYGRGDFKVRKVKFRVQPRPQPRGLHSIVSLCTSIIHS